MTKRYMTAALGAALVTAGLTATGLGAGVPPRAFLTPPFPRAGSLPRSRSRTGHERSVG